MILEQHQWIQCLNVSRPNVIGNRIVTRGFGSSRGFSGAAGPVTQGFGRLPTAVEQALVSASRRATTSETQRKHDEIEVVYLWSRLVAVTPSLAGKQIKGLNHEPFDSSGIRVTAQKISAGIKHILSPRVTVKRTR